MNTQPNSLTFRNLGIFLPKFISSIYEQLTSSHSKHISTTLQTLTCQLSIFVFLSKWHPHFQEGQELDKFTRFVSQVSYDLTWSNPCQLLFFHYVIQSGDFTMFFSSRLWIELTFSLPTSSWPWRNPVTLQMLKLHPKIIPLLATPAQSLFFIFIFLILSFKNSFIRFQLTVVELVSRQVSTLHIPYSW